MVGDEKKYTIEEEDDLSSVVNEPEVEFMKSFSSQEEAERYNLKKRLQKSDMERLQTLCRLIRIGQMLSGAKTVR